MSLRCEAIAWVDEEWPGWVRVRVIDADGRAWLFVDKVPIFFRDDIALGASMPRPAAIRCDVLTALEEPVVVVSTARDHVEAEDGTTEFRVFREQVQWRPAAG